ncbi:hypothetical protein [Halorussus ruber]|uniref:hypothetical protein n=1 Tax=Halorussus ruber TaxID=1126238 RepID=UPI001092B9C1|nr:hypothetical protein [Halorussus ruber]
MTEEDSSLSTTGLLADARDRLAANPAASVALLLAGALVAGADWYLLRSPVPTAGYEGIQDGRVTVAFEFVVSVVSRATVPPSALLHLKSRWLATAVGLELVAFLAVVAASAFALSRLLETRLTLPALARYGLVAALLGVGVGRVDFEGGAVLIGIPLIVAFLVVTVRLVPFPGRLVLGESVGTALRRSWTETRGHGWSLFGVVLVVGLANHLLASAPLAGPVGSGAMAAVHAGVVAAVIRRTGGETQL